MGRNIDDIIKALPKERRDRINADAQTLAIEMIRNADSLDAFRKAAGRTQAEVAKVLGIGQNAVSQLESRADLYVSTLSKYVGALGMKLELSLRTASGELVELPNFHPWQDSDMPAPVSRRALSKTAKVATVAKVTRHRNGNSPTTDLQPLKKVGRALTKPQHANASK
jgi:transcriptional regulator with XRE-family HTH domain